jgi:UDP-N-acetylglucosamine 2-epimerase (non-hydrolysing)
MRTVIALGTRPEIIKLLPVFTELKKRKDELWTYHSGQHYDYELSKTFLEEFHLPEPDYFLSVGSTTHADQVGTILIKLEFLIHKVKPDLILAVGDTNTVLATALCAFKLNIPFAHIEAGIRSFDKTMPEEINRRIVDSCSELLFAPTDRAAINLIREGLPPDKVFITGNPVVDVCLKFLQHAKRNSNILDKLDLDPKEYYLLTVHRDENTRPKNLKKLVKILLSLRRKIVFPIHPRTEKGLIRLGLLNKLKKQVLITDPLKYTDFLKLFSSARAVLTDSGGIQEESCVVEVPCITLRYNTERVETLDAGINFLTGLQKDLIVKTIQYIETEEKILAQRLKKNKYLYGDGHAGEKIANIITGKYSNQELGIDSPNFIKSGYPLNIALYINQSSEFNNKTVREIEQKFKFKVISVYRGTTHLYATPTIKLQVGDILEIMTYSKKLKISVPPEIIGR